MVIVHEDAMAETGVYVLPGSLKPAKDYIPVLHKIRGANRSIGLASRMERDEEGAISFQVVLEEFLNHDNFDWYVYVTHKEYSYEEEHKHIYKHNPVLKGGIIQALIATRMRYKPFDIKEETPT